MTEKQHIPTGERADFEAWVRRDWPGAPLRYIRDALPVNDPRYGQYCDDALQRAWVGWQARAAIVPSPTPNLVDALRQYQHNDGSGLVFGYDKAETERVVGALLAEVTRIKTIADNYYAICVERQQQIDAAQAKVAELEKQEPPYKCTPKNGGEPFLIRRAPDSWELRECMIEVVPAAQPGQVPEVAGIGRDVAHPRAVVLYLRKEPTDDDLRAIQVGLRMLAAAPVQGGSADDSRND